MEFEDGCLGGFLSLTELERYFIHGECKYINIACICIQPRI